MTAIPSAVCPRCDQGAVSVVTDRRIDALGEREKHTLTCPQGHTWSVEDDRPEPAPRFLRSLWTALRR